MTLFGTIGFASPWILAALIALPILWILLRAIPPAPIRRIFPGVSLLLGLSDEDQVSDRTPWWLLLLRILAVALIIIGLAGPILNPDNREPGRGPLLVVLDGSWASARDWPAMQDMLEGTFAEAGRNSRPVAVLNLSAPEPLLFQAADAWASRLPGLQPMPWAPGADQISTAIAALGDDPFETLWLSDGLLRDGRLEMLAALEARGPLRVIESGLPVTALEPIGFDDGALSLSAVRSRATGPQSLTLNAIGPDPSGQTRVLASVPLNFEADALRGTNALSLPSELRARVTRIEVQGVRSAGAVALADDNLRRREIAMIAGRDDREGLELLSPLHYLQRALEPTADLLGGSIEDILPANPDVIILADVATVSAAEEAALLEWLDAGGLLMRFAGPRLAASEISRDAEDPLMPVRLRAGGRTVGGAMSWGEPKSLAPFGEDSPFFGLTIPDDVTINSQVMAQPDPTLADRVIAQLTDGTPLVTHKAVGQGQVVLVHVTANAEWSSLPLSGLFVQMLERLAISSSTVGADPAALEGTIWQPLRVMNGFGALSDAGNLPGVPGDTLVSGQLGADLRPGLYAGQDRSLARNVMTADAELQPAQWPARVSVEGMTRPVEQPLAGMLLSGALLLLLADVVASLALSGRLRGAMAAVCLALMLPALPVDAQSDDFALAATTELRLAYVITGDTQLDRVSEAGLRGLSDTLFFRTSVEPTNPIGVNLETDELAFFPLLYWPISAEQPRPSSEAYAKLNTYLRSGGMILFDTRDANIAGFGASSPTGRRLQQLASPLDIPPLEPVPDDHVLTRAFYLLQDFPGRHAGRDVWIEAAPPDAEQVEGMPFRNLNDGVSPVVIGGNDWASAWAIDEGGNFMFPVGRGFAGERQRELSLRFGVNLVMHVLTGNYKSDQVHVPALLDRLGQ